MKERTTISLCRREFLKSMALGLSIAAASGTTRLAQAATPQENYVLGIANDVMGLANSRIRGEPLKARFVTLLNRNSDVRSVALFSLGQYQKDLPSNLKNDYFRLVVAYTAGLFVYYIEDFAAS